MSTLRNLVGAANIAFVSAILAAMVIIALSPAPAHAKRVPRIVVDSARAELASEVGAQVVMNHLHSIDGFCASFGMVTKSDAPAVDAKADFRYKQDLDNDRGYRRTFRDRSGSYRFDTRINGSRPVRCGR